MKKTILIVALVVLALGALGVGVAFAQDEPRPSYGNGWMHDYVEQALAGKLGITEAQVEAQLAAGKTMYQIALDNGIAQDEAASFLIEVHTAAFDKAVADGVVTRKQADFMLQRMQANGFNYGNCPMHSGQAGQYGRGYGPPGMMRNRQGNGAYGPGMMNGWRNQNP